MLEITPAPEATRHILCCDDQVAARAEAAFGLALPRTPCRAAEAPPRAALWLGPGEWLLLSPAADDPGPALAAALAGLPHSLVKVSHGFAAFTLRGPGAARALSAGCPLDLHQSAFPVGMATCTILGRAGITLWRRTPGEWHLETGRSLAGYVGEFLAEAARGLPSF